MGYNTWLNAKRRYGYKGIIFFLGDETIPVGFILNMEKRNDRFVVEWISPRFIFVDEPDQPNKIRVTVIPADDFKKVGSDVSDFYFTFRDRSGYDTYYRHIVKKLSEEVQAMRDKVISLEGESFISDMKASDARKSNQEEFAVNMQMLEKMSEIYGKANMGDPQKIRALAAAMASRESSSL